MFNKKTKLGFLGVFTLILSVAIGFAALRNSDDFVVRGRASGETYSLDLSDRTINDAERSGKQASFRTRNNTEIIFKFGTTYSLNEGSGIIQLAADSYFYNDTRITGITSIEYSIERTNPANTGKIYFGNDLSALNVGCVDLNVTRTLTTIDFDNPVDYFKIDKVTGTLTIFQFKIYYSCSNSYSYLHAKEIESNDLLYSSTLTNNMSSNFYTLDTRCFDVANSNSGFSFHVTTTTDANDWPNFVLDLGKNASVKSLKVYAKGVISTKVHIMLQDQNGVSLLGWNLVTTEITSSWSLITFSIPSNQIASGKNLHAVRKINFIFDFTIPETDGPGSVRELWFDNLSINEEAYKENDTGFNLEMSQIKTGSNYDHGSTSEYIYSGTCNSFSAQKFIFANETGLPDSVPNSAESRASFAIGNALGTSNQLYMGDALVEFDVLLSDEFFDSSSSYKNKVSLTAETYGDGATSPWASPNGWFDLCDLSSFASKKGQWIHVEFDLSQKPNFVNSSNSLGSLMFGFFGLTNETKTNAFAVIDNLQIRTQNLRETATPSNLEMTQYVRSTNSRTAAASLSFDVVHGTSTSCIKLTFADTTGLSENDTERVFAEFGIAAILGNDNGINVKNCTLSFDIKFSNEIISSDDPNKTRVTVDMTDSTGVSSSSWFQMNNITSYGDGWSRYSRNLNGATQLSGLGDNVGTIKLGFNGVRYGNQTTAYIYIDNLALTQNS